MRIVSMQLMLTEDDMETIRRGADIHERLQARPRGRGVVKDFIIETVLAKASQLIEENDRKTGRSK